MTDAELKELVASLAIAQRETAEQIKKTDIPLKDQDKDIDLFIEELGKQIASLGEKFGGFTEGLALPSMQKILNERFGIEVICPSVRASKNGRHMEIDVLAYTNSDKNVAYIVEVKSHLRPEAITQMQTILKDFREIFPEHRDKTVYGILAAVDISEKMREEVLKAGFYVAEIHDNVFTLDTPEDFQPTAY